MSDVEIPEDKSKSNYTYQQRRADLKRRRRNNTLPIETVLAAEYDVTTSVIRNDLSAIRKKTMSDNADFEDDN